MFSYSYDDSSLSSSSSGNTSSTVVASSESKKSPLQPGSYVIHNFTGEHADLTWRKVKYHHHPSPVTITPHEETQDAVNIELDLTPHVKKNPLFSVTTRYQITLKSVLINSHGDCNYESVKVTGANLSDKFTQKSFLTIDHTIESKKVKEGGVSIKVKEAEEKGTYDLTVKLNPQHIEIGTIGKALNKFGLLKETTLTGRIKKPQPEPTTDQAPMNGLALS